MVWMMLFRNWTTVWLTPMYDSVTVCFLTHMYAINVDGDVTDGDRILVASELHLQHALKTPTHEGGVREPRGHWGVRNIHSYKTSHPGHHLFFCSLNWQWIHLLTKPHILQTDDETSSQIEDSEKRVSHEGWGLQSGQRSSYKQSHGSAAVNHQPHQHEVEQETIRSVVKPGQPVDGQAVHQSEHAVLR